MVVTRPFRGLSRLLSQEWVQPTPPTHLFSNGTPWMKKNRPDQWLGTVILYYDNGEVRRRHFAMYKPPASFSAILRFVRADRTCFGTGGNRSALAQCKSVRQRRQ